LRRTIYASYTLKRLIKAVLVNLKFLVSEMNIALDLVEVTRRWRCSIFELLRLPPEP
jgi:5-formaminoimidazole-4-carboxamide-1-beta-D-ribofuranosyl 5'-monophosphate synthetase